MAKSILCLVLLAALGFTVAQLVLAEEQRQNIVAIAPDVQVQPKSEQVQLRNVREAEAKKKRKAVIKSKNGKSGSGKKKGSNKGKKNSRNIKKKCKRGKKCRKVRKGKTDKKFRKNKKGKKGGRQRGRKEKGPKTKKANEKKKKQDQNINSNSVQRNTPIVCDIYSCVQISKNYRKFRNNMNQVRRIINNCGTIKGKETKAKEGIFNASGDAICTEFLNPIIAENLTNCINTASKECTLDKPGQACSAENITKYAVCNDTITIYQDGYNACLNKPGQTNDGFCSCVQGLVDPPGNDCLNFSTLDKTVKKAKKKCTGSATLGSFGYCRKLQVEAADGCNCWIFPEISNTTASSLTTSGSGSGRKKFLRANLVKKWIKN